MKRSLKQVFLGCAIAVALAWAAPAQAAMVTQTGLNFDVRYDDSLLGLYGTPTLVGDTFFYFTPTNFKAESLNGAGLVTTNSTVNFVILPHVNRKLDLLDLRESGDYKLRGTGGLVAVSGQLRSFAVSNPFVYKVDDVTLTAPVAGNEIIIPTGAGAQSWEAAAGLAGMAGWNQNMGVNVTIENLLDAYTQSGSGIQQAFIEKKLVALQFIAAPVPEADKGVLLLAGLGLLAWIAARRQPRSHN